MYSAFWCSHCRDQKSMFGKDAPLPAFECFPDGWSKESEDGKVGAGGKGRGRRRLCFQCLCVCSRELCTLAACQTSDPTADLSPPTPPRQHGMAQECIDADLKGFPTWEFEGVHSVAGFAGCGLPCNRNHAQKADTPS